MKEINLPNNSMIRVPDAWTVKSFEHHKDIKQMFICLEETE
jgi:hypothetical protein